MGHARAYQVMDSLHEASNSTVQVPYGTKHSTKAHNAGNWPYVGLSLLRQSKTREGLRLHHDYYGLHNHPRLHYPKVVPGVGLSIHGIAHPPRLLGCTQQALIQL